MSRVDLPPVPKRDPRVSAELQLDALYRWATEQQTAVTKLLTELLDKSQLKGSPVELKPFPVAALPRANGPPAVISVPNEAGGATVAFSDGTNWRRVQDRAVVS
jgi:hypothetical protein